MKRLVGKAQSATIGIIANQTAPSEWPLRVISVDLAACRPFPLYPLTNSRHVDESWISSVWANNRHHWRIGHGQFTLRRTILFMSARRR
jgi:hypothetical protein